MGPLGMRWSKQCIRAILVLILWSNRCCGWLTGVFDSRQQPGQLFHPSSRLLDGRSCSLPPLTSTASPNEDDSSSSDDTPFVAVGLKEGLIRYRGRVAYDGSRFQGFQIQQGSTQRTIQGALEEVLTRRFHRAGVIRVVGAGRTDAGVSARGQAFHFDLTEEEHAKTLQVKQNRTQPPLGYTMNRMLTDEIRVWNVGPAPPPREKTLKKLDDEEGIRDWEKPQYQPRQYAWNAIHDSTHKLYSYRICVATPMDPIYRFQRWQIPENSHPVNMTLLEQTLKHFEGTHDFRAFAGAVEQTEKKANRKVHSVRTIYECNLVDERDLYFGRQGYYRIDIVLSGALYKMVRNMVGTAMDVSRGKVDEATFLNLLHNEDGLVRKDNRSKPAPPEGLTLERVFYGEEEDDSF